MSETVSTEPSAPEASVEVVEPEAQELGDAGKKAIQAERDARKAADARAASLEARLKEFEDSKLSELERAQKEAAENAAELSRLRAENIRSKVAIEKGVPADLIEFLTGETEGDIAAKAETLMARLNAPGTPKPDPSQGAKGSQALALNGDPLLADLKNKLGIA